MIRSGEEKDIPEIIDMSRAFWKNTAFSEVAFESDIVETMANKCIDESLMFVLEVSGKVEGFACGVKGPMIASLTVQIGTELVWWVNPRFRDSGDGVGLLSRLENSARNQGVKYWNMVFVENSMPDKVKSIYENMGYKLCETVYTKEL
jgi:L-amino acid N-acyltransferase YncA